eukprot:NODE_3464_length_926_cov_146.474344_g2882_i0.p2 GENE.NODE_3464_length_926_cov_146.474344_g2882_i0~~NODE_3464_length_926_cov_146.474344_g2882_i0.p2  ORF type:complete len:243 (-),score=138.13 NODE_3464_length_926_cov_146.474344_g2882_i0:93-821(-)
MPPKQQQKKAPAKKSGTAAAAPAKVEKKAKVPEKPAAATGNAVYITNFKMEGKNYQDIKAYWAAFGTLAQLRIKRTKKKHGPPYILAFYENANGARKALERNGNPVDGQKVHVEYAKKAKPTADRANFCTTVFISPVSKNTKKAELATELKTAGNLKKVRVYAAGHALAYYDSVEAANKAFARYNGGELFGKKVSAKYSVRTLEKDRAKFVAPLEAKKKDAAPKKESSKKSTAKKATAPKAK